VAIRRSNGVTAMNEIAIFVLGFFAAIGFVVVLASLMALTKEPSKRRPLSRPKLNGQARRRWVNQFPRLLNKLPSDSVAG
jgi:hypothetical protein